MTTQKRNLINCLDIIHKNLILPNKGYDFMDVIYIVTYNYDITDSIYILEELVKEDCELDFPMNIKLPIKTILETAGLLEGIYRYLNMIKI